MTGQEHLDLTFAALADGTRRAILMRLAEGEASVNELCEPFALSQPAISKHIKVLEAAGLVSRGLSLARNARLVPRSTLHTAIGIRHPQVAQRSMGFMGGSFNTREFFHGQSATLLRSVKWIFLLLVFPLPLLCLALALSSASTAWLLAAFALQYLGLLAERWYFFAQANHPQNLYYQTIS